MGDAFIVRRGGGGKAFAVIAVTYPAGSTITCTDGTKNLKAQGTDGQAIFLVPYAGTWTVTARDGTDTASKTVNITYEGQNVSVELSYWSGELYMHGEEYSKITGGWVGANYSAYYSLGDFEKKESSIYISTSSMRCIQAHTVNKIDLTKYATLWVNIINSYVGNNSALYMAVQDEHASSKYTAQTSIKSGTKGLISLDVSELTGEYYVLLTGLGETASTNVEFDEVYMT